jgi:hypothetical protein
LIISVFFVEKSDVGSTHLQQGCQIVYFQTKNQYLGKFWMVLQWNMLEHFMGQFGIHILRRFGLFCGNLVFFSLPWYVAPRKIWQH